LTPSHLRIGVRRAETGYVPAGEAIDMTDRSSEQTRIVLSRAIANTRTQLAIPASRARCAVVRRIRAAFASRKGSMDAFL
jgi:hypothetical protein